MLEAGMAWAMVVEERSRSGDLVGTAGVVVLSLGIEERPAAVISGIERGRSR